MPLNGLVTMTPTSIASTGTGNSSSINTNGSVTFASCASLSLNGVFTSSYDNYMIIIRHSRSTSDDYMYARLRASGSDNTTASSYVTENLEVSGTIVVPSRSTTTRWYVFGSSSTRRDGGTMYLFGPYLSQTTAFRSVSVDGSANSHLFDAAGTHNASTSFTGITFENAGGTPTYSGLVTVYGFNQ
jgi:hypothetical protein